MTKKILFLAMIVLLSTIFVSCDKKLDSVTVNPIINVNEFYGIDYNEAVKKLGKLILVESEDLLITDKNTYITQDDKMELIFTGDNKKLSVISLYSDKDTPFVLNEEDDIFKMLNISKGKDVSYAKFYPIFFNVDDNGYIDEVRLESDHREYPKSGEKISVFFSYD